MDTARSEPKRDWIERELAELEHLYRTAPVGLCLIDSELRYLRINEMLAAINGCSVSEHIGRTLGEVIPEVAPSIEPLYRRVLATGEAVIDLEIAVEVPSDPGTKRFFLISHHPLRNSSGEVVAVASMVKDITALKTIEEELARARDELEATVEHRTRELRQANATLQEQVERRKELEDQLRLRQRMDSVGALASGIAHDFNNLLQGIIGNLSLLENLSADNAVRARDCMDACNRASVLAGKLGTLSVGSLNRREPTDLYIVASEVFSLLRETTDRLIEKRLDVELGEFTVFGMPSDLHQVLLNLATNAIAAIEDRPDGPRRGDSIALSAKRRLMDSGWAKTTPGPYVHLSFSDTGVGMCDEVKRRAFEPMFTTRARSAHHGQGLGLAMVYSIVVNGHGGHVEIETIEGTGTTLHVWLPEAKSETPVVASSSPTTVEANTAPGSQTVLVVDDEPLVRNVAVQALSAKGYCVITASDGDEALERYAEHRPDLVVLDLVMPRQSGAAVCRAIRERDASARIVISSGDAGSQLDERLLEGPTAVLPKPYQPDSLIELVGRMLEERRGSQDI